VETVAENMVDGITAPIFWAGVAALFSGPLPLSPITLAAIGITAYKTINTMDSMFGYKNDEYIDFGRVSAQIDDIVNFIPARLSGLCIVAAAQLLRKDWRNSLKIFLRDRLNHSSPNAAHSEAALAGALGLRLGGASSYFGETVEKPLIGDEKAVIGPRHILDSNRIILFASLIFAIFLWCCMKFYAWIFSIL
jgi:adenosylcobinamide-phosphate synthase